MKRKPIPQHEFGFADQAFALVTERTADGEREAREREQLNADRLECERNQLETFPVGTFDGETHAETHGWPNRQSAYEEENEAEQSKFDRAQNDARQPGLAAGSFWS